METISGLSITYWAIQLVIWLMLIKYLTFSSNWRTIEWSVVSIFVVILFFGTVFGLAQPIEQGAVIFMFWWTLIFIMFIFAQRLMAKNGWKKLAQALPHQKNLPLEWTKEKTLRPSREVKILNKTYKSGITVFTCTKGILLTPKRSLVINHHPALLAPWKTIDHLHHRSRPERVDIIWHDKNLPKLTIQSPNLWNSPHIPPNIKPKP